MWYKLVVVFTYKIDTCFFYMVFCYFCIVNCGNLNYWNYGR